MTKNWEKVWWPKITKKSEETNNESKNCPNKGTG